VLSDGAEQTLRAAQNASSPGAAMRSMI